MRDELEDLDYQILEYKSDNTGYFKSVVAKKNNKDQFVVVEREESPSFLDIYQCTIKMLGPSKIDLNFGLSLPDPKLHAPSVEEGREEIYFIEATDNQFVRELLEDESIYYVLTNLMNISIDRKMRISSKNKKSLVKIETDCNINTTLAALPWMDIIFELIQKSYDLQSLITGSIGYTCNSCQRELSFRDDKCKNCGAKTPICVICLKQPSLNQKIAQTNCCQSFAHVNEMKIWIKVKNICPYCRTVQPSIKIITK